MAIKQPKRRWAARMEGSRYLSKRLGGAGKKAGNFELNLTPMVDMFTLIVIFLLQQFSATGEVLFMSKDIQLPDVQYGAEIARAPVVGVSAEAISLEGKRLVDIADIERDDFVNIPQLEEALRDLKRAFEFMHQNNPDNPHKGDINIQADKKIPFKVIKRVMYSSTAAGYGNINFAALTKSKGAAASAEGGAPPAE